uniref:Uncharacterized protein n=1 Tax=Arundo donax TaxID=35708 RepID=A0A0A9G577_ARUDO
MTMFFQKLKESPMAKGTKLLG